jgi:hypothetical protein
MVQLAHSAALPGHGCVRTSRDESGRSRGSLMSNADDKATRAARRPKESRESKAERIHATTMAIIECDALRMQFV